MNRHALNLQPRDEIQVDGNWWIVQRISVDYNKPAPVLLILRGRDDPEFNLTMAVNVMHRFDWIKA